MKITVILPSYKPHDYLWECLGSLARQTMPSQDFEIIMVLNGCRDPYLADIKNYVSRSGIKNLKLMQTDEGGVSNARNLAIGKALGEYIAFIDDDDYVSDTYLESLYSKAAKDVCSVSKVVAFDDVTRAVLPSYLTNCFNRIARKGKAGLFGARSFMSVPVAKLLDKKSIGSYRFNPKFKIGEDSLFMFQVSKNMKYIQTASPDAIYYRRVRKASASMSQRGYWNRTKNNLHLIGAFVAIYGKDAFHYNLPLFLSRITARLFKIAVDTASLLHT